MAMFELKNESAGYNGKTVLHDISLTVSQGERVALVGPSGAGKSTLLGLLYAQQKRQAALVPQISALVRALSVFHNVYIGRLHEHSAWYNVLNLIYPLRKEMDAVLPTLERLGMADKLLTAAGELSGGQQQRTGVARALYHGGAALLGDEPVSAVDAHQSLAGDHSQPDEKRKRRLIEIVRQLLCYIQVRFLKDIGRIDTSL